MLKEDVRGGENCPVVRKLRQRFSVTSITELLGKPVVFFFRITYVSMEFCVQRIVCVCLPLLRTKRSHVLRGVGGGR